MSPDPVLHLLAGPNGSGKSTLHERVIGPATGLPFVNADVIAVATWPDDTAAHAYEAASAAARRRESLIEERASFATETVFSHGSKLDLVATAVSAGYLVTLHVVMVPEDLAVARVRSRVRHGGHPVPEEKVRDRFHRLWPLVAEAALRVDRADFYDNSRTRSPFRQAATLALGRPVGTPSWPSWCPPALRHLSPTGSTTGDREP